MGVLTPTPLEHAQDPDGQQDRPQPESRADADTFGDHGRDERHKDDRHGQAIPDETIVVGREMVVGRSGSGQEHAKKHCDIKPALAWVGEEVHHALRCKSKQEPQSPDTENGKSDIGGDVAEVGDAEPPTMIGEVVVAQWLRHARREACCYAYQHGECDKGESGSFARHCWMESVTLRTSRQIKRLDNCFGSSSRLMLLSDLKRPDALLVFS